MNKFAERLKAYRNERNLTQSILGDDLGVSRQAVSLWESARATPEMARLLKLANMMNVPVSDLVKDIVQ